MGRGSNWVCPAGHHSFASANNGFYNSCKIVCFFLSSRHMTVKSTSKLTVSRLSERAHILIRWHGSGAVARSIKYRHNVCGTRMSSSNLDS